MFYKVVRQFKQADDPEQWREYMSFSRLDQIEAFCSLDGMFNYYDNVKLDRIKCDKRTPGSQIETKRKEWIQC